MNSKTLRYLKHFVKIGDRRNVLKILIGKPTGKIHLSVNATIIVERILKKKNIGVNLTKWLRSVQDKGYWKTSVTTPLY